MFPDGHFSFLLFFLFIGFVISLEKYQWFIFFNLDEHIVPVKRFE